MPVLRPAAASVRRSLTGPDNMLTQSPRSVLLSMFDELAGVYGDLRESAAEIPVSTTWGDMPVNRTDAVKAGLRRLFEVTRSYLNSVVDRLYASPDLGTAVPRGSLDSLGFWVPRSAWGIDTLDSAVASQLGCLERHRSVRESADDLVRECESSRSSMVSWMQSVTGALDAAAGQMGPRRWDQLSALTEWADGLATGLVDARHAVMTAVASPLDSRAAMRDSLRWALELSDHDAAGDLDSTPSWGPRTGILPSVQTTVTVMEWREGSFMMPPTEYSELDLFSDVVAAGALHTQIVADALAGIRGNLDLGPKEAEHSVNQSVEALNDAAPRAAESAAKTRKRVEAAADEWRMLEGSSRRAVGFMRGRGAALRSIVQVVAG